MNFVIVRFIAGHCRYETNEGVHGGNGKKRNKETLLEKRNWNGKEWWRVKLEGGRDGKKENG